MNKPILLILAGVLVVVAALGLTFWPEDEAAVPPSPEVEAPREAQQRPMEEPDKQQVNVRPSFDVVRVSETGDAVIAGRATPLAEVAVLDGGVEIGTVAADERGEWVFVPSEPLKPGDRVLSLRATNPDGTVMESEGSVILSVPDPGAKDGKTLAVKVGEDGATEMVYQGAGDGPLTIDAVDYSDQGRISVTGRTEPGSVVRLYLDNDFVGEAKPDENGRWRVAPEQTVSKTKHTLRADALDKSGKVIARIEAEFTPGEAFTAARETIIVVRSGANLWNIARRLYGSGFAYTYIYEANKSQIRDPDLIYPGQVFTLPKVDDNK